MSNFLFTYISSQINNAKAYYEYLDEHPDVDKNILMRNLLYVCSKTAFFELSNKVLSGEEIFDIEKCYRSYIEKCNFSDRDGINPEYLFTYSNNSSSFKSFSLNGNPAFLKILL